ncbi:MAG: hypothetical protein COW29_10315, partial [Rhodobacterales bacterium CG15_BIG_FIL_POST_REV_8_21_14_020_59_13]
AAADRARALRLSKAEALRVRKMADPDLAQEIAQDWPIRGALEKRVYRHGNVAVADQLFLLFSREETPPEGWGGALAHALSFAAPVFPVTGADLKQAGIPASREMGGLLRRLENDWVDSRFRLSKAELLERV